MSKAKILVVDDSESFLASIEEILRVENHDVIIANDLQSALGIYQQQNPDLVITDVNLSALDIKDQSGLVLLKAIHQHPIDGRNPTPVILMSSDQSVEDTVNDYSTGSISFIAKPFDPQMLLKKIDELCQ